jgi:hypothetical protein
MFFSSYFIKKTIVYTLFSLQTILSLPSIEELLNPNQVIPQYIMYNMANTSKHGVVILQDKSGRYLEKNLESFQT